MNSPVLAMPVARGPTKIALDAGIAPSGCNWRDWLKCAGVVAGCAVACCGGACIGSPACIACLGGAYGTCSRCF